MTTAWSSRIFAGLSVAALLSLFLVYMFVFQESIPSVTILAREIREAPYEYSGLYHNTLIVDHLQPEDFQETSGVTLPSPFKGDILKAKLIEAERLWQKQVGKRTAIDSLTASDLTKTFQPSFSCPLLLEKVGNVGPSGSGKWICGFELFETPPKAQECVIYTFGSGEYTDFEQEWLQRTDCHVLMFGHNQTGSSPSGPNVEIIPKIKLDVKDEGDSQPMRRVMKDNDHGWLDVLYLSVDGMEYDILNHISKDYEQVLPFAQLIVDFHVEDASKVKQFTEVFQLMEHRGFRPFYVERIQGDNCVDGKVAPVVLQYSFLNIRGKHLLLVGKDN